MNTTMMIPAARTSMIPTVTVPAMRALKAAAFVSQDGETVWIPEAVVRCNTAGSVARTVRPARRVR